MQKITALKKSVRDKFEYSTLTPAEFEIVILFEKLLHYQLMFELHYWVD